jgi:hypothetical protein
MPQQTGEQGCPRCGRPLDEHNRHLRFALPDPVLSVPKAERQSRTWGNDVMMQVKEVGSFVRVLLPVRLSGGYTVTFGPWLSVHPDDLRHVWEVWWSAQYRGLKLGGYLANSIPPWGLLAAPCTAEVLNPDHAPYLTDSAEKTLARVLREEWPHDPVLSALPANGA